jgi:hypothetical protein
MLLNELSLAIKAQLTAQRLINPQVLDNILNQHQQTEATIGTFFAQHVPTLADIDCDLLFSPAYTPTLLQRSHMIALLKDQALSSEDHKTLLTQLIDAGLSTPMQLPDGSVADLPIPEVCIIRYLRLLKLNSELDMDIYAAICTHTPIEHQPLFNTLAREAAWQHKTHLLKACLPIWAQHPPEWMIKLTDFVRTYRPNSLEVLDNQLESYIRSCESDLNRAGDMSFHDERLKEKYVMHHEGHGGTNNNEANHQHNYLTLMDDGKQLKNLLNQVRDSAHAVA